MRFLAAFSKSRFSLHVGHFLKPPRHLSERLKHEQQNLRGQLALHHRRRQLASKLF
jgi:hypothetical protein